MVLICLLFYFKKKISEVKQVRRAILEQVSKTTKVGTDVDGIFMGP